VVGAGPDPLDRALVRPGRRHLLGIAAILIGAALVFFLFPGRRQEEELLRGYQAEDTQAAEQRTA
jgi:hypothetical protein